MVAYKSGLAGAIENQCIPLESYNVQLSESVSTFSVRLTIPRLQSFILGQIQHLLSGFGIILSSMIKNSVKNHQNLDIFIFKTHSQDSKYVKSFAVVLFLAVL